MSEIVLVTLSGPDGPGVTSSITEVLAQYGVNILDVGQAVIHNNLSLGLLIEIPVKKESAPILKEVLFLAHKLGMAAKFNPVETQEYEDWVNEQGKDRYIVTLLARRITASQLSKVTQVIAENK